MKKAVKWIFITICVGILAIDFVGFWKYKLKGTNYQVATSTQPEEDVAPDQTEVSQQITDPNINYEELESEDFENGEKLFIINIDENENEPNKYTVKGLIYEEYEISKEEYNNINSQKGKLEIFGIEYSKDKMQSNNLKLQSTNSEAEDFYIKYDTKNKKYILKESTTDYTVYKATEKYVQTIVDGNLDFVVEKNGRKEQSTVAQQAEKHNDIQIPEEKVKINLSELTYNKKGICTQITKKEINV